MEYNVDKLNLFCLPFAGGSASSYLSWNNYLKDSVCVVPVQLSGRGERYSDKPYGSFEEMADDCFNIIKNRVEEDITKEYALFGHSMGSWIVYEICKRIYETDIKRPVHVIFSGNRAPYYDYYEKKIHELPDNEFIDEVLKYGGGERKLLEDKSFGKIFLNILRNDFRLIENYKCDKNAFKINCDISVFNGIQDNIPDGGLLAWAGCTSKNSRVFNFEGNHFFIFENVKSVTEKIKQLLFETVCV